MTPLTPEERDRKKKLTTEFEQSIRKRKLRKALQLAGSLAVLLPDDAENWFKVHLAATMYGKDAKAEHAYAKAKQCRNSTSQLEGDMMRDIALQLIRQGKHRSALNVIGSVLRLHQADRDRFACAVGVKARAHFGLGDYAEAVRLHVVADAIWNELARRGKPLNPQWQYDNLLPMFRVFVMRQRPDDENDMLEHLYERVVMGAPVYGTTQHVLRARLMRLGPSGVYLDMAIGRLTRRW